MSNDGLSKRKQLAIVGGMALVVVMVAMFTWIAITSEETTTGDYHGTIFDVRVNGEMEQTTLYTYNDTFATRKWVFDNDTLHKEMPSMLSPSPINHRWLHIIFDDVTYTLKENHAEYMPSIEGCPYFKTYHVKSIGDIHTYGWTWDGRSQEEYQRLKTVQRSFPKNLSIHHDDVAVDFTDEVKENGTTSYGTATYRVDIENPTDHPSTPVGDYFDNCHIFTENDINIGIDGDVPRELYSEEFWLKVGIPEGDHINWRSLYTKGRDYRITLPRLEPHSNLTIYLKFDLHPSDKQVLWNNQVYHFDIALWNDVTMKKSHIPVTVMT